MRFFNSWKPLLLTTASATTVTIVMIEATPTPAATLALYFDAFIPEERAPNPASEVLPPFYTSFIGDNRGFDLEATQSGQARLFSRVVLDLEADKPLIESFTDTSPSVGFRIENGEEVSDTLKSASTSVITATRSGDEILLNVFAEARNPLIELFLPPDAPPVPPAQYDYQILLAGTGNFLDYTLSGTTREYPAYSTYIADTPVLLNLSGDNPVQLGVIEPIEPIQGQIAIAPTAVPEPTPLAGLAMLGGLLALKRRMASVASIVRSVEQH
jgi:hypothetical protein